MAKIIGDGCNYCMNPGNRQDFRGGKVDLSDFYETVRFPKAKKKDKKHYKGCPGNDGGPHIYVWTLWIPYPNGNLEELKCCGCEKPKRNRRLRFVDTS